jgi:hypothetical protein
MKLHISTISIILILGAFSITQGYSTSSNRGTDWMQLCGYVQGALYQSCDNYVDDDGDLTRDGETAFGCIRNGAILGGGAMTFGLPPGLIIGGLNLLAGPTGCDGIVNLQILNNMGGLSTILNLIG